MPFRFVAPPTTAFIAREAFARRRAGEPPPRYRWVDWQDISPKLALAVLVAEDQRFPVHGGFDWVEITKALEPRRRRLRGASTITQQLAKNLYLWPGRSLLRKSLEAWLTLAIEASWPKRRILEVYLNVAEMGRGIYGVGAASRAHFGVAPDALSLEQASLLAAVLPSPRRVSARAPSDYVQARAQEIADGVRRLERSDPLRRL